MIDPPKTKQTFLLEPFNSETSRSGHEKVIESLNPVLGMCLVGVVIGLIFLKNHLLVFSPAKALISALKFEVFQDFSLVSTAHSLLPF